ncbi:MAG: lipoyl domain-containing protein [Desulfurococcales archaeon]|nr:lipoyl domain-containing protein [Desulfurococcales archaeon]
MERAVSEVKVPQDIWPRRGDWKGRVVTVFKRPGDKVSAGEAVAEIEIEKAILSIESPVSGIVEDVRVSVGDEVRPGDVLLTVREV